MQARTEVTFPLPSPHFHQRQDSCSVGANQAAGSFSGQIKDKGGAEAELHQQLGRAVL